MAKKTWLITGASSGFGRSLAERVAAEGDHVIAIARRSDRLAELASQLGAAVTTVTLDITAEDAETTVADAITAGGGIDVLVNNAGYGLWGAVQQTDDASARAVFDTNVFAGLTVLRAALPALRANAGRVVQISSFLGQSAWPASGLYSASKAAVELISEALALEVASSGVRVTVIEPGTFGTEFVTTSEMIAPDDVHADSVGVFFTNFSQLPAESFGDPQAVAEAIIGVVRHPEPPLRLAVGADAVDAIRQSLTSRLEELERWEQVSLGKA